MKVYRADSSSLTFIRVIILVVMVALDVVVYTYLKRYLVLTYVLMSVVTALGVFFSSIYLPMYFKYLYFRVGDDTISKESGFFIKSYQTMKVSSIQYVTYVYIPLFRYIGFNFIVFNALGGYMLFNFLSRDDSSDISNYINKRINR